MLTPYSCFLTSQEQTKDAKDSMKADLSILSAILILSKELKELEINKLVKRTTDWGIEHRKLATATYRLRVLNKRAGKKGGEAQVDRELDLADLDAMVANRTAVIDAVTAHKATL